PLNADAATDTKDDVLGDLATDGKGTWIAIWATTDGSVESARSTNGGASWTTPMSLVGANAAGPSLCTDALASRLAAWSTTLPRLDTDRMAAHSTNAGATWSPAELLNATGHTDEDFDGGGTLGADARGTWLAPWT